MVTVNGRSPAVTGVRHRDRLWAAVAVAASLVPFAGGFSLTRIFFVRDLTMFFWPRHLFMRETLLRGSFPLWDPYAAAGQPFYSDALNQLFLPPVLLLRVLFPAIVGFNLIVALPFPLTALGTWLFLRRRFSPLGATLGATVFAASGPVISTGNFPNLSWSVAWIPWILWAVDRDGERRSRRSFALVAALLALQMLSGEPVTMLGTLALMMAYAVAGAAAAAPRVLVRRLLRLGSATAVAGAISAVQLIPMALAARNSLRGVMKADNFWSLHPLALLDALLPHLFGNPLVEYESQLPWSRTLNSARDPFFYSLYLGPVVLVVALLGALGGPRRWRLFWAAALLVGIVMAFGEYTPIYPVLQAVLPLLHSFRFPVKFLLFAALAVAMLVANGTELLETAQRTHLDSRALRLSLGIGAGVAVLLLALGGLVLVAPFAAARVFFAIGQVVGLPDPVAGAAFLFRSVPPAVARALFMIATAAVLAYASWKEPGRGYIALILLVALAGLDVLAVNSDVNPVIAAARIGPPEWVSAVKAHPSDRFYFGGKFRGTLVSGDVDQPRVQSKPLSGPAIEEARDVLMSTLAMTPSAWGVRELLSYDLPQLWPLDIARAQRRFEDSDRSDRYRFLVRGGVRYCILDGPAHPGAVPLGRVGAPFTSAAVYECVPDARRTFVATSAIVMPDVTEQISRLFSGDFDAESTVMLERPAPDAAGPPGFPLPPSADLVLDGAHQVAVDASAPKGGGYVVLLDSYDSYWNADVDDKPAPLLRANALYRAVRVAAGRHRVTFRYRPLPLYASLSASCLAALMLLAVAGKG